MTFQRHIRTRRHLLHCIFFSKSATIRKYILSTVVLSRKHMKLEAPKTGEPCRDPNFMDNTMTQKNRARHVKDTKRTKPAKQNSGLGESRFFTALSSILLALCIYYRYLVYHEYLVQDITYQLYAAKSALYLTLFMLGIGVFLSVLASRYAPRYHLARVITLGWISVGIFAAAPLVPFISLYLLDPVYILAAFFAVGLLFIVPYLSRYHYINRR